MLRNLRLFAFSFVIATSSLTAVNVQSAKADLWSDFYKPFSAPKVEAKINPKPIIDGGKAVIDSANKFCTSNIFASTGCTEVITQTGNNVWNGFNNWANPPQSNYGNNFFNNGTIKQPSGCLTFNCQNDLNQNNDWTKNKNQFNWW
jgi:hypothetical protein